VSAHWSEMWINLFNFSIDHWSDESRNGETPIKAIMGTKQMAGRQRHLGRSFRNSIMQRNEFINADAFGAAPHLRIKHLDI